MPICQLLHIIVRIFTDPLRPCAFLTVFYSELYETIPAKENEGLRGLRGVFSRKD